MQKFLIWKRRKKKKLAAPIQQELKLLENLESILTNTSVYHCAAPDK